MAHVKHHWHTLTEAAKLAFPKLSEQKAYQNLLHHIDSGNLLLSVELYSQLVTPENLYHSDHEAPFLSVSGIFTVALDNCEFSDAFRYWLRREAKEGPHKGDMNIALYCVIHNEERHIVIFPEHIRLDDGDIETLPVIASCQIPISNLIIQDDHLRTFIASLLPDTTTPMKPAPSLRHPPLVNQSVPSSAHPIPIERKERRLRLPEVLKRMSVSKSKWYKGVQDGHYPDGKKDGGTTFWLESDIEKLILHQ